jgi:hypothetical protein
MDIILGLTEHSSAQGTINNVIIILKYYIYVCRCKCRDPDLEGGLEFLKYAINIEKASMHNYIPKRCEPDFLWFLYKMYIAQFLLAHIYIERNL